MDVGPARLDFTEDNRIRCNWVVFTPPCINFLVETNQLSFVFDMPPACRWPRVVVGLFLVIRS